MNNIDMYLEDDKYIEIFAEKIIEFFENESNSENTYCEFDLEKGKMKNKKTNTRFRCDIYDKNSILYKFKKDVFIDDTKITNEEEREFNNKLVSFFEIISEEITEKYHDRLETVIRKSCLPDSDKNIIPMSQIEVTICDITNIDIVYSFPGPYILNNYKDPNSEDFNPILYQEPINIRMKKMMDFISKKIEETGESSIAIFDKEKMKPIKEKDVSFLTISPQSTLRKTDWDLSLDFYVDYSLKI